MVLVLNRLEVLDEILEGFVEVGVSGATILDSKGMGTALLDDDHIPIFGGLRKLFEDSHPSNKTILSVVKRKDTLDSAIEVIDEAVGGINESGAGILFTIPIDSSTALSIKDK